MARTALQNHFARLRRQHETFFKSDMPQKPKRRRSIEGLRRKVYRQVDVRDDFKCRACGRACLVTLDAVPNRWERHHIKFRSLGGEDTTSNIVGMCCLCHCEAQQHRLKIVGDANEQLEWTNIKTGRTWHS